MGRIIVTRTKVSKIPYVMKKSGHLLYSYEELCYYIRTRMALWLEENVRAGLTEKMKEWGLVVSDIDLLPPEEAAVKIMDAGTYFRPEEKEQILEYMKEYEQMEKLYREKEKGDLYLYYEKNKDAYLSYWQAVSSVTGEEEGDFKASLYHNYAIACCKFFYWKEAKNWFARSLNEKDTKEARMGLELVLDMEKKGWFSDGTPISAEILESKKQEFLKEIC